MNGTWIYLALMAGFLSVVGLFAAYARGNAKHHDK